MTGPRPPSLKSEINATPTSPPADGISRLLGSLLDEAAPTPLLSPIKRPTASSEVADRLMTAIAMGDYLPGDRLPTERQLAATLEVTRTSIREAIARLEAVGVIEVRRGRLGGSYVCRSWGEASAEAVRRTLVPRWPEFQQLLDLRGLIEDLVGRTAAERGTPGDFRTIRNALSIFAKAETPHDEQLADSAFHRAVLEATGNPQLFALSRSLLAGTSLAFPFEPWHTTESADRCEFLNTLRDHEAICEAIVRRDVDEAGRVSRQHFTITVNTFRDVVERAHGRQSS
ncbi:MAG: FadR/GntR family transcriptional regulator [Nocardioidaceae bacterium]